MPVTALSLASTLALAAPATTDASNFIYQLYGCTKAGCDKPEGRYEKHLSAETGKLFQKIEKSDQASNQVCIDWDIQNATNAGLRPVKIDVKQVSPPGGGTRVAVEVSLIFQTGKPAKDKLTYSLLQERGEWVIDDIGYVNSCCGRETLVQDLKACQ